MIKTALLIGVSEYKPGLNPLPEALKDIEAMQRVLQNQDMGGFDEVKTLANPDPLEMQEAIEMLFSDRTKDDLALLFFSGHGIKDNAGRLYFATQITRKNRKGELVKATAVPANFVHDIMGNSRCRRGIVILDCCFSGAFAVGMTAKDDGSVDVQRQLGGEGRVVLTASTSSQYSFEEQGSDLSVYTRYLVEGIETGAADLDGDGVVSIEEWHDYASARVRAVQPSMKPGIYAVREGFKIRVAKIPPEEPKQKYRKEVKLFVSRGEISLVGRRTLDVLRMQMGLSEVEATAIEKEVLEPFREEFRKKLHQYEQVFCEVIKREETPGKATRDDLRHLQSTLGLRNEDTMPIEARVIARLNTYKQKLQQYESEFTQAMQREYPLSKATRDRLHQIQQSLELTAIEVAPIEALITTEIEEHREKLQAYEQALIEATGEKRRPLNDSKRRELEQLRQNLNLSRENIAPIEARITNEIKERQQNLQRYQQALVEAIRYEYPLGEETANELRRFQKVLSLSDEDVTPLKERIITQRQESCAINPGQHTQAPSQAIQPPPVQSQKQVEILAEAEPSSASAKSEQQVAMPSVLVSALLVTLGLLGGGVWSLTQRLSSDPGSPPATYLKPPNTSKNGSRSEISSPQHTRDYINDFSSVENVPSGEFAYGGSAAWVPIHRELDPVLQAARPEFKLRYTLPSSSIPSSSEGIRMLLNDQLAFAYSSRPLHSDEYQKALQQGYNLSEITVALEGIAIVVHPDLDIPGLTLPQLKDIYTGKITNWSQVGGANLAITPYSLSAKDSGIAEFFAHFVMQDLTFAENVTFVPTATSAVGQVAHNVGGIYYGSAPEIIGQCTIKPLPIGYDSDELIPPYQEPLVTPSECPGRRNQLNVTAMQTGQYPILQPLFVAVKHDSQANERAGEAYAHLLLTDLGQELIRQAGFIPIRCLSHYADKLATCHHSSAAR
ncbi:MAG: substrate-binding domain-containing protein [Leptolyngbyaceae cyanobacterium MO_188.B28]|nr:substrate-binding domain-containing protein [Leptolyngbyaceae cyanobacterium MO_188.B28]